MKHALAALLITILIGMDSSPVSASNMTKSQAEYILLETNQATVKYFGADEAKNHKAWFKRAQALQTLGRHSEAVNAYMGRGTDSC